MSIYLYIQFVFVWILLLFLKLILKVTSKFFTISIISDLVEKISFYFFNSNHPRRFHFYKNKLNYKNFVKLYKHNLKNRINIDLVFIGDSHVEVYSRPDTNHYDKIPQNTFSVWLGPRTILGMNYDGQLIPLKDKIKKLLNKNQKFLIFSFGSIDVRYFFYEIKRRSLNDDDNKLLAVFENACLNLIKKLILPFKNELNIVGLGICEIPPSLTTGTLPNSVKDFKYFKSKHKIPTFGTIKQRKAWTIKANLILKKLAENHNINWIETSNNHKGKWTSLQSSDGIHITSETINVKIKKQIYSQMFV